MENLFLSCAWFDNINLHVTRAAKRTNNRKQQARPGPGPAVTVTHGMSFVRVDSESEGIRCRDTAARLNPA